MTLASILAPGTVVGGEYVVVRPLEEGGMGAVYLVEQKSTGKQRALKVMHRQIVADAVLQRRFEQEAKIGARIKSEHVVEVVAAGIDDGTPWLVMELLLGEDLRHRLDARGALPAREVRVIFEQLSHAMEAAHEAGVVHRDLKPENVFLAENRRASDAPFTVKVLDFGIAKLEAEAGTRATHGALGSPLWMAPEQTSPGPVTAAADVWALGLLAYELLVGKSFWRAANEAGGTTAQLLREIVLDPIPLASARAAGDGFRLPPGFDAWLARCLARDATERFASAGAMWRAMQPIFGDRSTGDALAATFAATPAASLAETAAPLDSVVRLPSAAPVHAVSEPVRASESRVHKTAGLAGETPVATVQNKSDAAPPPPRNAGRSAIAVGLSIAVAGIAVGWGIAQRRPAAPVVVAMPSAGPRVDELADARARAEADAKAKAEADARARAEADARPKAEAEANAKIGLDAKASGGDANAKAAPLASVAKKAPLAGGFADPTDRNGAVLWKVQGRQIRLFTKLASNESNVTDAVVRKAIDWSSWEYLRCYERAFGGVKDLPEGIVTVDFEIIDQLPRHAKLRSSTIASDTFNGCVVSTLLGQTINAAGPDGKGKAAFAFRFQPMD